MKLKESLARINDTFTSGVSSALVNLRREDAGWSALFSGGKDDDYISLNVIQAHAKRAKQLAALNPLVKRGITVRNAYMFTDGAEVVGASSATAKRNYNEALSMLARARDEATFITTGTVVYLANRQTREVSPVAFDRVTGIAREDGARGVNDIYAFQLEPLEEGEPKWYVVDGKEWKKIPGPVATDKIYRVVYECVNRADNEIYGKPDLMGALYYAQAYKEYLESAYVMAKALSRIAYKVSSVNARQQAAVSGKMSGAGRVGDTAMLGAGQELQAVSKSGAGIDFSAASPLASMISASLDVPLSVLLTDGSAGGRQGAETALEDPTFKTFDLRREIHANLIRKLGEAVGESWEFKYGAINNDQTHRRVQSIVLAFEQGLLWDTEARSAIQQVLRTQETKAFDDMPPPKVEEQPLEDERSTGVGPLSDGTNDNRPNGTDA